MDEGDLTGFGSDGFGRAGEVVEEVDSGADGWVTGEGDFGGREINIDGNVGRGGGRRFEDKDGL